MKKSNPEPATSAAKSKPAPSKQARPFAGKKPAKPEGEKKKSHPGAWVKRPPKGQFEPDPKDANTINSIQAKLQEIREYKKILAQDGLKPDEDDKLRESNLIKQLIRIEKGLPPIKSTAKPKKKKIVDKT